MKIIPFPGSGLTKRGNSSENYRMDANRPLYLKRKESLSDRLDISTEARMKFQQEKIVKLGKARLAKEAQELFTKLDRELLFYGSDPRKSTRKDRIVEAKLKLDNNFYNNMENNILKILVEKFIF